MSETTDNLGSSGGTPHPSREYAFHRRNEVIRLADLTVAIPSVESTRFEDCLILGPAVVLPKGSRFQDCSYDTPDVEALLWPLDPQRTERVVGVIELVDCEFHKCRFTQVGFAVDQTFGDQMRSLLGGKRIS